MARVLVSGGCGFIGSHVCDRVLRQPGMERCLIVDNLWAGTISNPNHIKNDRDWEIPVIELARYISKVFGNLPIHHLDPVPQDPTNRRPDLTLTRSILPGWECKVQYERGLQLTVDWFRGRIGKDGS